MVKELCSSEFSLLKRVNIRKHGVEYGYEINT